VLSCPSSLRWRLRVTACVSTASPNVDPLEKDVVFGSGDDSSPDGYGQRLMHPQTRLARFEHHTEWPLAAIALAFLGLYSVQILLEPRGPTADAVRGAMYVLYFVFVADYLARLYLADPRGKWFLRHLLDLAIVALPFLRPLRLLSLAVVVDVFQRAVGDTIRLHGLRRCRHDLCSVAGDPGHRAARSWRPHHVVRRCALVVDHDRHHRRLRATSRPSLAGGAWSPSC
jgi:hypothetical protein